jgi:hypothetical protein
MFNSVKPRVGCAAVALMLGCVPLAQAQTSSVGDLIAKSKALKTQELQGATPPKPASPSSSKTKAPAVAASKPKLWSITGVDDKLTAVLLHQQKAFTVHSTQLPADVGPWQVTEITDQHVWLVETKAVANKRQVVVLDAPDQDTKLDGYVQALQKGSSQDEGLTSLLSRPPQPQAAPLPPSLPMPGAADAASARGSQAPTP